MSGINKFLVGIVLLGLAPWTMAKGLVPVIIQTPDQSITVKAKVAETPGALSRGLSNTPSLPLDEGMLFVFPQQGTLQFWMKDTQIPLDILFIDNNHQIVDIQHMTPCTQAMCSIYASASPARYALEVNAHFCKDNNINSGDAVTLPELSHKQLTALWAFRPPHRLKSQA